ncbi:potassium voltage-gated channel subfamily H member 8 isoform X2 [Trichogramma pretiosum]|uniref:potassium voltage-gated channel subfamily H member 8 isoform X2 n=1 Tax=Trichogramma pretiosum TaxID=7493 RepID=UPI0006C9B111|nr:potassium voltage-gated channel subfamily H member 8 isoform X2 [Trichogramma pretiosum]
MPARKGLLAPQNTFLDTIATRFDGTHSNFVLGNAQVPTTYPIVYCSDGFCDLTGYPRAQIMQKGCACKFLYGPDTLEEDRAMIDKSLESKTELKLEVTFYKKCGAPFNCLLDIVPIKNEKGDVVLFLASHKDITHTKNLQFSELYDSGHQKSSNFFWKKLHAHLELSKDPEAPPANYGRRRSRAVLYQLSGHYKQDNKHRMKLNNTLLSHSQTTPLPEYKTTSLKKSQYILSHYGVFRTCWDWLILIATIYVACIVPFNASFINPERPTMVVDVIVEVLFIIDIILNFNTTYVNKKGEVVSNTKDIACNYIKCWFLCDILAALPFDLLYATDIYNGEESGHSYIHLVKLTRLTRLARIMDKMDTYSQYSFIILPLLMVSFAIVAHWMACIWYFIAERERDNNDKDWDLGWLHVLADRLKKPDVMNLTFFESYSTALYFTCSSLTSVGFGNVSANTTTEKSFSVFVMFAGALMHAVVFGNVTAIIQRMYSRRSLYQTKLRDLKEFLDLHQIPDELKQRMEDYFQTMWSLNHGIDIHETLKELPEELRGDVSMHLNREILSLPIFEAASQGCLKLLSLHIRSIFCAPGEFLIHKGDALSYIYYLCNGSMEVVQNEMVVAILGKGDLVGCDISVHLAHSNNGAVVGAGASSDVVVKSSCDVKALTYCDLKCIHMPGLVDVLRLYPEYQQQFANDIQHDLTYNLREGYEAEQESEINGGPSLTLPSISEDDENAPEEGETSPLSPHNRSPMHGTSSPRHAKLRDEYPTTKRVPKGVLRSRTNQLVPQESSEDQVRDSYERLHQDVAMLSNEVRNALQALQMLASSPQSNPNLPTPSGRSSGAGSNGVLARSSSHPPDALCWNPPARLASQQTQTDWPVDLLESWVRQDPHRVLRILGLDPELVLRPLLQPASLATTILSPTPSPSSPPPPPYEPLSPLLGSPIPTPSQSPHGSSNPFEPHDFDRRGGGTISSDMPSIQPVCWETTAREDGNNVHSRARYRRSAGDADKSSPLFTFKTLRRLPDSRSLTFDPFDS